jgi:hypothetical protein
LRRTLDLTADQRRALGMIADAGPAGSPEAVMALHFGVDLLAGLVCARLVSVRPERMRAGGRSVEVVRMRLTEAGRLALTS